LYNDGENDGAIEVYDQALAKFPEENQFLLYKAVALSEAKQFDDCIDICDEGIGKTRDASPMKAKFLSRKGKALLMK
jgi:tetratricopeptide (TPR) repeat protein